MRSPTTYFRYSLLASFLVFISLTPVSLVISLFIPIIWKFGAYSLFFPLLINLALTIGIIFYNRLAINPQGMRCSDSWGRFHFLEWSTITNARYHDGLLSLLGFKRLLISTTQFSKALWLPLFLNDMPRLKQTIADYAGRSSPLVIELARENTQAGKVENVEKKIKLAWQGGIVYCTITLVFMLVILIFGDFFCSTPWANRHTGSNVTTFTCLSSFRSITWYL